MSWELCNDRENLGQFASNAGYADLIKATAGMPALVKLFETGESDDVAAVIQELRMIESPQDVAKTAQGLIEMLAGAKSVLITDGLMEEDGELQEKAEASGAIALESTDRRGAPSRVRPR